MTSLSDGLSELIDRLVENDRRHARRTGEYIDKTNKIIEDSKTQPNAPSPLALPASSPADFKGISDSDLKKILRAYGVKGYTQKEGKRLARKDRVKIAIEHKVPVLSFAFLLEFYLSNNNS